MGKGREIGGEREGEEKTDDLNTEGNLLVTALNACVF